MAVAKSNGNSESSLKPFFCYRAGNLTGTILETNQALNFKDRYVLGEQLGWGQFGIIRVCSDKLTGELLACKSIAKDSLVTQDDVRSVKLEIEIMTRLSGHPNIVELKAVYEEEDCVHLVMELCAGGELFHQLEEHGRFSEAEARVLFRHLMQVIMYCHDMGVVHRDLKPENILLATGAPSSPIKLADFGLATYMKPGKKLHGTVGSPFYIAPEVLAGGYNQAADVWSAGVILYILLSGTPPFWGKTKSRIFDAVRVADLQFPPDPWNDISGSVKELITNMLCRDPTLRLTAQQVLDHSWIREPTPLSEIPYEQEKYSCSGLYMIGGSVPTLLMARNQDISFGTGSPIICNAQLPAFTCRSSLSSFLVDPATPYLETGGFSFGIDGGSNTLELCTGLPSMQSFAFFSPAPVAEQGNCALDSTANMSGLAFVPREANFGKLSPYFEHVQHKVAEARNTGGKGGLRLSGIYSKRNRTIGFGESEQLGPVISDTVTRWASCTHLPTAPSLRSPLVC